MGEHGMQVTGVMRPWSSIKLPALVTAEEDMIVM
jgi:hypothetical protein